MQDVFKNIDEYNADKERKILIVFDGMIADMINKLFLRGRKSNIPLFLLHYPIFRFQKILD